ncbi:retrovirus-related pol polyprotein from transposon TNT 1-94 [Tanacetum coccineum]
MPLTFQPHSLKERPGLGIMKHTKPETRDSSNKSVSGTVTVSETKQTTPSVPTKVKDTKQESRLNELTKLVQMLINEKVNSDQKTQESNSNIQKAESSKSVDLSKISQDSKPKMYIAIGFSTMICKREDHRTSNHDMYIASLKRSESYKAQPYQYASSSKQILIAKAKPFPPCTHYGFNDHIPNDCRNYPECGIYGRYDHSTLGYNRCNTCGSTIHSTSDHNEFDHFKRETHQGAHLVPRQWMLKAYDLVSELYASNIRANQIDDKQRIIFNANKEIVLIAPRRNDVYVLDMSSLTPNGACFFAKASEILGLPSLVYSKDKPCTACEKGKHHRASFKTKQNFSIRKCLHLLHIDLFGPVSPMSINHKKYTLVIVDEYSRYTWVYFLRNKSQAPEMIMSFVRMVENQNDIKVKQIRTDNGTEFRNHKLERCPMFIHNHKDHLGKFDVKADDGYFLGYSSVLKAFKVYNTRRQQIEETYHVTFDESMEAIRFTNTLVDKIGIDDSSRYPPDEFQEDDPSRQYQHEIPHTEDTEGTPDSINTEGTHEQNIQNDQMITQPTNVPSGNNTEVLGSIIEPLVPDVTQSHIINQASTSSHHVPQDRWSRDQHIEHVNIIGDPGKGMLTRSMAAKLTAASASECLFVDFLSEIEPKKVYEALKHPGWIDAMQEKLNQNKKDEHGTTTKNKARLVAQGYSQEEGIDYNETFTPVSRMEAIRIFLDFATYINFKVYQMDFKSAFLNGKLKEEVYVKQPPSFESSEFPNYVCKLDKALYGLKQAPKAWQDTSEIKSMMAEIYQAFKGQPSSASSGSVTPTLALTHTLATVEGGGECYQHFH